MNPLDLSIWWEVVFGFLLGWFIASVLDMFDKGR